MVERNPAIAVGTATLVVLVAALGPALFAPSPGVGPIPDHPEYDPASVAPNQPPDAGQIQTSVSSDAVVAIDDSHRNPIRRGDLGRLTKAIVEAGGSVTYLRQPGIRTFNETLRRADAFVIVEPRLRYTDREIDAIEAFVADGGRLLVAAEPNRRVITQSTAGGSILTARSQVTELAAQFGLWVGSEYLYNMDPSAVDGNFQNLLVESTGGAPRALVGGVREVAAYTATPVGTRGGQILLRAPPGTGRSATDRKARYPVAAVSGGGDVVVLGDSSMLLTGNVDTADNEAFAGNLVDFLLRGDTSGSRP